MSGKEHLSVVVCGHVDAGKLACRRISVFRRIVFPLCRLAENEPATASADGAASARSATISKARLVSIEIAMLT
ncbi:hypothetical protein HJC23_006132 [Cyclotella cryptica]|uniref:Uncharacterized protein n=1 Tax=Cyclotella cryptica TaxID=29204 RepID=A0ABD3QRR1_9STRA